ncbi:FHF complex subunit HOOK interacting protein 2A-like isoform X1 [Rhopalosiphum padi]|uniref:FHF complex subunit HOOK interacting protein 2A-like isoform X1 n=2 Tax=Rhopalosiphum padi TaxID=40932 RepID=UPI00298E77AB|nr:FHF complex subunit HOOK interacting protein 2A-like isoform X1 [Rhopalosiphum padi]
MIPVLNTILDSVVDTIAPPTPAFENFIYHWEKFMINYLEWTTDGQFSQTRIEETNVPGHLEIVQQILLCEDKNEETATNLCMEYVLKNDLFNMLAVIAEKEKLIGIRILVLKYMTNLISQLKNPVLAHQSFFVTIQRLINLCDSDLYNKQQQDQIHFLYMLCTLLNNQQNVSIMFFSYESNMYHLEEAKALTELSTFNRLNLLDCVLTYINTKNTDVYYKCCNCILLLTKLNDENVIDFIINKTKLCSLLSEHFRNLFCALPIILDYNGLETIELNWRDDYNATYSNDVTKFFCWLNFIIEVIKDGQLKISYSLCESLRLLFFNKLFDTSDQILSSHVFLLKKIYKAADHTPLSYTINYWLRSELDNSYYNKQTPIDILIKLSSTTDDIFVFNVLNFFIDVLHNSDKEILDFIILRFINNRNYYEGCTSGTWSDEEDEREKKILSNENNINTSRTLAPSSIDRIINRLLALIPQNLQSDQLHTFKDHITDVKNMYEDIFDKCTKFEWPTEALNSVKLNDFNEGPFLRMIFKKISDIPNQNSSTTLQLKIILIFLSSLPHPYLHEYLLNSTLPLKHNVPSLYMILYHVLKELHKKILTFPNYNEELIQARKRVLNNSSIKLLKEKHFEVIIFNNAVILEELCKELVAVLFVKYHHSNLAE